MGALRILAGDPKRHPATNPGEKMNTENTPRRNATLDLIRSLAAAEVAIGHMRDLVMFDFVSGGFAAKAFYLLTAFGKLAVIVFFVLSGYWVGGSVVRDVRRNAWSW
ncbi:hypothetical protein ACV229_23895 [Burkholderia sp. MR1-5-21]